MSNMDATQQQAKVGTTGALSLAADPTGTLLADFFSRDDLKRLTMDAGALLACPVLVLDEAFRVVAHYAPAGPVDEVFQGAVRSGEITYEAGAMIERSPTLAAGEPDYINLTDSPYRRRFSTLSSSGVKLGYLVCVDVDGRLESVPAQTWSAVEQVLSKQLFIETSRQNKPFETVEDILVCLLNGGFSSQARFWLQASGTYLADFHPHAFALVDLTAYHAAHIGKRNLKDELRMRFGDAHPFLYKGDILFFLNSAGEEEALPSLAEQFQLNVFVSDPLDNLYDLPGLYCTAREALELMADERYHGSHVCHLSQLRCAVLLKTLEGRRDLISSEVRDLASYDKARGTQYCETLYRYLTCSRSLKATCEALYTHRNTVLYRIRKMRDDFGIALDDPGAYTDLLLGVSLALFHAKGPDFFVRQG